MIDKQKLAEIFKEVLSNPPKEGPIQILNDLNIGCYFVWDPKYGIISLIDNRYDPTIHCFSKFIINFNDGSIVQNHTGYEPRRAKRHIIKKYEYIKNMMDVLNIQES